LPAARESATDRQKSMTAGPSIERIATHGS
jgi:hypothetical protein